MVYAFWKNLEDISTMVDDLCFSPAQCSASILQSHQLQLKLIRGPEIITLKDRDILALRELQGFIICLAKPPYAFVLLSYVLDSLIFILIYYIASPVARAVIYEDLLPVRIALSKYALYALSYVLLMVVRRCDDRD